MERELKTAAQPGDPGDLLELPDLTEDGFGGSEDAALFLDEDEEVPALPPTEAETVPAVHTEVAVSGVIPENRPRKVYTGMWGQAEIAAVGIGLLAIAGVVILFFFLVLPAKQNLERSRAERDLLEEELRSSRSKYGSITDTQTEVASLLSSVDDFEARFLRIPANGQPAIYQQLNGLIGQYGLVNTAGPDYAPLGILDGRTRQQQPESETGRDKLMSLFPGLYVTLTVEGSYGNLRRFIRDIETSGQFIMISSIEFVPADAAGGEKKEQNGGQQPAGNPTPNPGNLATTADAGKTHGETVSLKLEMAAYFSRSAKPSVSENPQ